MPLPAVGAAAPDFRLPAASGRTVGLADFKGRPVLLWFFPRAYGGNCTKQACSFRDHAADFGAKHAVVLGITTSTAADLKAWGAEVGLVSELLSDTDKSVCEAYGAFDDPNQERPTRVSILIGTNGLVAKTWAVKDAEAHPAEALKDLVKIA